MARRFGSVVLVSALPSKLGAPRDGKVIIVVPGNCVGGGVSRADGAWWAGGFGAAAHCWLSGKDQLYPAAE